MSGNYPPIQFGGNGPHPRAHSRTQAFPHQPNAGVGNQSQRPLSANQAGHNHQQNWNGHQADEKLNWSEIDDPVEARLTSSLSQEKSRLPSDTGLPVPPSLSTNNGAQGEIHRSIDANDDGGWVSGYKEAISSPPSQPFHQVNMSQPDSTFSTNRGSSMSFSSQFDSHTIIPSDSQNVSQINPQSNSDANEHSPPFPSRPYEQSDTHREKDVGKARQRPLPIQLGDSRSFQRAFSSVIHNQARNSELPTQARTSAHTISPNHGPLRSEEVSSFQAPTYTGPIVGGPRNQAAVLIDANRIPVAHTKQWGNQANPHPEGQFNPPVEHVNAVSHHRQAPMWSDIGSPSQAAWDQDLHVERWVNSVDPSAPSDPIASQILSAPHSPHVNFSEGNNTTTRPGSAGKLSDPEKSNNEHGEATPPLSPNRSPSPPQQSEVNDPASFSTRIKVEKAPNILTVDAKGNKLPSSPTSEPQQPRALGQRTSKDKSWDTRRSHWWKRPPHPMYSPSLASQRIYIKFPCSIRIEHVKPTLTDHFSKYGEIRAVYHFEAVGNSCEKGVVIFQEAHSVVTVLRDPNSRQCTFQATPRAAPTFLELDIKPSSALNLSRTVLIRMTGPRVDDQSGSASPAIDPRYQPQTLTSVESGDRLFPNHTATLPASLLLDAVPRFARGGLKLVWSAKIRSPNSRQHDAYVRKVKAETGQEPKFIGEIDLSRRFPEKDIIPRLCDYFVEVCEIYPPTLKGQGWRVTVSGFIDARNLMSELQKIPGFFVRWADEADGVYPIEGPEVAPSTVADEFISPIRRMHNDMKGLSSKHTLQHQHNMADTSFPTRIETSIETLPSHVAEDKDTVLGNSGPTPNSHTPIPNQQYGYAPSGYSPNHPHLRRSLVHTYKGRPLIEDITSSEPKYIDERAVFVGKLVKTSETGSTLFNRFEKYGKIATIEYNPQASPSVYTTARILYQDKDSADRAIAHENNQISFGSALMVAVRRVLPMDVHTKELYIDDNGRAVSPSMVSQYSPTITSQPPPSTLPNIPPAPPPNPHPGMHPMYPSLAHQPFGLWYHPPPWMPTPYSLQSFPQHPQPGVTTPHPQTTSVPTGPIGLDQMVCSASQIPLPMLCAAWGISYLPPGTAPMGFYPHPAYHTNAPAAADDNTVPVGATGNLTPPRTPVPLPTEIPDLDSPPSFDIPDGLSSRSKLKPIGFKNEEGMLRPVYDPEDLREYCNEYNITLPETSSSSSKIKQEQVTLLPIQSGGHDPVQKQDIFVDTHEVRSAEPREAINMTIERHLDNAIEKSMGVASSVPLFTEARTVPARIPFSPAERYQELPMPTEDLNPQHTIRPWSQQGQITSPPDPVYHPIPYSHTSNLTVLHGHWQSNKNQQSSNDRSTVTPLVTRALTAQDQERWNVSSVVNENDNPEMPRSVRYQTGDVGMQGNNPQNAMTGDKRGENRNGHVAEKGEDAGGW
ncbi:uncharacterized protein IL334_004614 [Kwoniella shivajii]|uniref:RRM domain-containing protein n=1 Tax=Kwoniella shivajii TaxID=564305 RepID=A0ABZ1D0U0_9TREE|nr:hypothetical protein IL334_004614 [Kwoniella shivajii]